MPDASSSAASPQAKAAKTAVQDLQRLYSIAELAREFGITARAIRFYEDEGLLKPRREGLTRIYSAGDRAKLGWIRRGQRLGFKLAEIKELLDLYQVDRTGVQQMRELLKRTRTLLADLEGKRRDLDAHIHEIKDVETLVAGELKKRGVDLTTD
jgi:DNA-binding transcriptional MerR regulator